MSDKETAQGSPESGSPSRLGRTMAAEGHIEVHEDLVIEGRFKGDIIIPSATLTIAQGAKVEAGVQGRNVIVDGELTGNVSATERVQVRESAAMTGDITAARISVSSGARFKGALRIKAD